MTQNQELTSNICHWKRAMNVRYLPHPPQMNYLVYRVVKKALFAYTF